MSLRRKYALDAGDSGVPRPVERRLKRQKEWTPFLEERHGASQPLPRCNGPDPRPAEDAVPHTKCPRHLHSNGRKARLSMPIPRSRMPHDLHRHSDPAIREAGAMKRLPGTSTGRRKMRLPLHVPWPKTDPGGAFSSLGSLDPPESFGLEAIDDPSDLRSGAAPSTAAPDGEGPRPTAHATSPHGAMHAEVPAQSPAVAARSPLAPRRIVVCGTGGSSNAPLKKPRSSPQQSRHDGDQSRRTTESWGTRMAPSPLSSAQGPRGANPTSKWVTSKTEAVCGRSGGAEATHEGAVYQCNSDASEVSGTGALLCNTAALTLRGRRGSQSGAYGTEGAPDAPSVVTRAHEAPIESRALPHDRYRFVSRLPSIPADVWNVIFAFLAQEALLRMRSVSIGAAERVAEYWRHVTPLRVRPAAGDDLTRLTAILPNLPDVSLELRSAQLSVEAVDALVRALRYGELFARLQAHVLRRAPRRATGPIVIRRIDLAQNELGDHQVVALAHALRHNALVTQLHLEDNRVTCKGAAALSQLLTVNGTLVQLGLQQNQIGTSGVQSLAEALRTNESLAVLSLGDNQMGSGGGVALARALPANGALRDLDLGRTQIGGDAVVALGGALAQNAALRHLGLGGNDIGAAGAAGLAEALSGTAALESLALEHNRLGAEGTAAVVRALRCAPALQVLNLEYNQLGDEGAALVAEAIAAHATVEHLDLGWNAIGPRGGVRIARACGRSATLRRCVLRHNAIGPPGAEAFAEALAMGAPLVALDLECNQVGPAGALALAQALHSATALRVLNLQSNAVGHQGAIAMADAMKRNRVLL